MGQHHLDKVIKDQLYKIATKTQALSPSSTPLRPIAETKNFQKILFGIFKFYF